MLHVLTKLLMSQVDQSITAWFVGANVVEKLRQRVADSVSPAEVDALVNVPMGADHHVA